VFRFEAEHLLLMCGDISMTRHAVAAGILLGMVLGSESRITACSCVVVPTTDYLRSADIVYTGRVVDIRTDARRYAWPEIEFRVERTIKGRTEAGRFVLVTGAGKGVDCRGFDFIMDKTYLVFATARDSVTGRPGTYGVNWCGGTASLESSEGIQRLRETLQPTK
jgi:hypothetical protein